LDNSKDDQNDFNNNKGKNKNNKNEQVIYNPFIFLIENFLFLLLLKYI
jgi:hypothetical protein